MAIPADYSPVTALDVGVSAAPERAITNPYDSYLARLAPQAERTMRGCLDRLAGIALAVPDGEQPPERLGRNLAWWQLRYEHAAALRRELQDRYPSAATVNKHLSALR